MTSCQLLSASMEDYLEVIFHITKSKGAARAKDIATALRVAASSVTGALKALAERGLVNYAPYDIVTLTAKGDEAARDVIRRHEVLRDFFVKVLAVEEQEADEAACKMEHSISRSLLERLIQFATFVETCPRGGAKWIAGFGYQCSGGCLDESCEQCISHCLTELQHKKQQQKEKNPMNAALNLVQLPPGQKARIVKILPGGAAGRRMAEMGITPGTLVEVERVAPLGDPVDIRIKGYHLSLRKAEAATIDVEPL
ncbi:MAG: DtxR family transcriptional regulator [Desulfobulbaceae bacterium A2]|uniref:Transcriptional regulator MntR n=1 Tax=Rhodoferax ferrireducens TaxID=192843 RepID=A0A1W9KP49_9BURK|nr:MAG: DtxR family transcriptional regulator [Rhodoferax ferrireducens]OQX18511.1 MAG: DtxR family transcriptional regulator [Desulfobulbaceae bacterium A2]